MTEAQTNQPAQAKKGLSLPFQVLIGALAGVVAGLFAGDFMRYVMPVGKAYVQLLAMCVYPYLLASLVHGLGGLKPATAGRLFAKAWHAYALGWGVVIAAMLLLSLSFPSAGAPKEITPQPAGGGVDLVSVLVPGNLFAALIRNYVPAVVLFAVLYGFALQRLRNKESLLAVTANIKAASVTIWRWVVRISPLGVFALFAGTAGTLSLHQVEGVVLYLVTYTTGAALLAFWVLPALLSAITGVSYRDIMRECRDGIILSLVTTLSVVSLPAISRAAEKFAGKQEKEGSDTKDIVGTNISIAYPFAQFGNLVVMLFILFGAFYFQNALSTGHFLLLPILAPIATVGSPSTTVGALSFFSALFRMPEGAQGLYVATMTFTRYGQVALSVMGFAFITILSTLSFYGKLRVRPARVVAVLASAVILLGATAMGLRSAAPSLLTSGKHHFMELGLEHTLARDLEVTVHGPDYSQPEIEQGGEYGMNRIRRTGVLRVGYHDALIPFCYRNGRGELVGHDVAFMYRLARDLNVHLEFVPTRWGGLKESLDTNACDITIGAIHVTPERLRDMALSKPYHQDPLSILARSEVADRLDSREGVRGAKDLTIGYFASPVIQRLTRDMFPNNRLVQLRDNEELLERDDVDAVVWGFTQTRAFARSHEGFTAVVPDGMGVPVAYAYAMGADSDELRDYVDAWIDLQRANGFADRQIRHWMDGMPDIPPRRRWCILRDVLHWVD